VPVGSRRAYAHGVCTRDQLRSVPGLVSASRFKYSIPYRRRYLRQRVAARGGPTILLLPHRPHPLNVLFKVCALSGTRITSDPRRPVDVAMHYSRDTRRVVPDALLRRSGVLNVRCTDISKVAVEHASVAVFGYGLSVDPTIHQGLCVEKSDNNGTHDGREIVAPIPHLAVREDKVYQRIVNNVTQAGEVEDLRVVVFGRDAPLAYRKFRSRTDRFSNINTRVELVLISDVLDAGEQSQVLAFCEELGLDFGELDILRDRDDGRIYVVDANPTPSGPPNHLGADDQRRALELMTRAFGTAFLAGN
jgi:hypothetical protein